MKRIAYTKPSITELEVSYATDAAQNGWGERCYDYIHRFEDEWGRDQSGRASRLSSPHLKADHREMIRALRSVFSLGRR